MTVNHANLQIICLPPLPSLLPHLGAVIFFTKSASECRMPGFCNLHTKIQNFLGIDAPGLLPWVRVHPSPRMADLISQWKKASYVAEWL